MALDPEIEEILKSIQNDNYEESHKSKPIEMPEIRPAEKEVPGAPAPSVSEPAAKTDTANQNVEDLSENDSAPDFDNVQKKRPNKKTALALGGIIVVIALIAGIFLMTSGLYVKKYEAKYKIEFPKGIPQEMCDAYGKNQTLAGSLSIKDNGSETLVYSEPPENAALFEKGSDIKKDQHYRAIALTKDIVDLESIYKDAESFKSSSQSFTFKTVYGEKQKYQVIAAYIINTDPKDDNGYAFPYNCYGNFTKKSYSHYQDTVKCRSLYTTGYKIKQDDYCLTLSVPTDIMPNFRFVVVGVKVDRINKLTKVKENARIRYPQAYCDKIGIHNIYGFAYKWYPEIVVNSKTGETKQLTEKDFE